MDRLCHRWFQPFGLRINGGLRFSILFLAFILLTWSGLNHSETLNKSESRLLAHQTVLIMGDSLSAAFGIDKSKGWVALLQEKYQDRLLLMNASISGETTSGGRFRITQALKTHQPELVIIELGGNDGLRGTPVSQIKANLDAMINSAHASGAEVILLGMRIPPNYGKRYTDQFAAVFPELAEQYNIKLVPFFLEGVAGHPGMMQDDGIHPTEQAQPIMAGWVEEAIALWLTSN